VNFFNSLQTELFWLMILEKKQIKMIILIDEMERPKSISSWVYLYLLIEWCNL
jgi:hypothetical protein